MELRFVLFKNDLFILLVVYLTILSVTQTTGAVASNYLIMVNKDF